MNFKTFLAILCISTTWCDAPTLQKLVLTNAPKSLQEEIEARHLGKPIERGLLESIRNEILSAYREEGSHFILVDIAQQDVTNGTVSMNVCESTLSEIRYEGNRHFSCAVLGRYIHANQGEKIDGDRLLNDLAFANRNPFRTTNALFQPGKQQNTTEMILMTEDRFPLRVYGGGDNTGNDYTGNARWFTGFTAGNLFYMDHTLSYQYTTSSNFHKFQSHTAQYLMPMPNNTQLMFFGGVSFVHPNLNEFTDEFLPVPSGISTKGFTAQASGRYEIPLGTLWQSQLQEMTVGFDYKRMNNNLIYIGDNTIPIIYKFVTLTQFMARYSVAFGNCSHRFSFENNLFFAPGQLAPSGNNTNFNNLRNNASNRYAYGRLALQDTYQIPANFSLYGLLRGQWASGALLPSEQYGLGGYDTVRGYDEREFNADQAIIFNGEIHTPKWHFMCKNKDAFYFLAFADFAGGWNYSSTSNEESSDWLGGVGAGFRYHIERYLDMRLDYGIKLHKDAALGHQFGKLHAGLIASF
jgi:hemolysin activation/secretion protein